ncbi:hypothetical protein [Saccharopolyspora sp. NPDC049426]|uniref:hypothetical protein n=1 Tax=Saccharopolyspora sp. NPDC049426 TaxID=3155652 RepID=UPI003448AE71
MVGHSDMTERKVSAPRLEPDPLQVAVLLAWSRLTVDLDPDARGGSTEPHQFGLSEADEAALEIGLELREAWGASVRAVCLGPQPAEEVLRRAMELGIDDVIRIDGPVDSDQARRAYALAAEVQDCGVVLAGSASPRCGSGSVPAFVAHHLRATSGLGVGWLSAGAPGVILVERWLDGGRRERLELVAPCVTSVEPSAASLRCAQMDRIVDARQQTIPTRGNDHLLGPLHAAQRRTSIEADFQGGRKRSQVDFD